MSINKRKVIIISSIIFLCTFLVFSYTHFLAKNKIELDEHSELLSIWVEDSSGNYQVANSFPGAGYILDKTRSKCENGGTLSGDGTGVTLTADKSDKCYLYFIQPWINVNATKTLTCNSSLKTWDNKINGASFSVSTDADLNCTATKTANSTSQNFASYIMSLAGTTQGTGQVVHEQNPIPSLISTSTSSYSNVSQSEHTLATPYYASGVGATLESGTDEASAVSSFNTTDKYWITSPSLVSKFYYYKFTVANSDYYKLCYQYMSGGTENTFFVYKRNLSKSTTTTIANNLTASSTSAVCYDLGYIDSANENIKFVQRVITETAQLKVYLKRSNSSNNNYYDAGYRYEGLNPNNYVWFNNELWRIIGVFDEDRHGIANTNLVKIIRDESIGGYAWDGKSDNSNNWAESTLYRMLNGCYYYAKTGSDNTIISGSNVACSNYCIESLHDGVTSIGNCDFSKIGIQGNEDSYSYRDMIENVNWYSGSYGQSNDTMYPDFIYGYEVNPAYVISGRELITTGYVGLMYASDYGYCPLASSCTRNSYTVDKSNATSYFSVNCSGQCWLVTEPYDWMITVKNSSVYSTNHQGYLTTVSPYYSQSVRPVVYLKANTYKLSGNGSIDNPYVLGMA